MFKLRTVWLETVLIARYAAFARPHALLHQVKTEHQYLGRYSVDKLCAFHRYQPTASIFRVLAVIILTPLPTLLTFFLLDSMKLRDPRLSVNRHATTFLRSAFSHSLMTYVILLAGKQAMGFTAQNSSYTHARCMLIGACVAVTNEAIWATLACTWEFPVSMRELLAVRPWGIYRVVSHFLLAKDDFARELDRLKKYLPVVTAQLVLFYFLLDLSIVFSMIPYKAQLAMIFVVPVVKFTIKHQLWKFSRELDDISAGVTICMTVCIQYVRSGVMVALIMGMDFLQAMIEVRTYMNHDYVGDTRSTLGTSFKVVQAARSPGSSTSTDSETKAAQNSVKQTTAYSVIRHWSTGLDHRDQSTFKALLGSVAHFIEASWRRLRRRRRLSRYAVRRTSAATLAPLRRSSAASQAASSMQIVSIYLRPHRYREHGGRRLMNFGKLTPKRVNGQQSEPSGALVPASKVFAGTSQRSQDPQHASPGGNSRRRSSSGKAAKVHAVLNHSASATYELEEASELHQRLYQQRKVVRPQTTRPGVEKEASPHENLSFTASDVHSKRQYSVVGGAQGMPIDNIVVQRRDQARILEQTLQLLSAAEVLLFVEYMEVFMLILYAACIVTLWELPNAKCNVILSLLTNAQILLEVSTSVAYAELEFASFLSVYLFVKKCNGISALYQLAFLLETYWMTLQGKLIGCFIRILNSSTIHQGIDLAFWFDMTAQLQGVPLGD